MRLSNRLLTPVLVLLLAVTGASVMSPDSATAATKRLTLTPVLVTKALSEPVQVTSANDGTSRLFVVEKAGRIRIVSGSKVQSKPYLDVSRKVSSDGERGLLGVAFSPSFRTSPYLWVTYTRRSDGALVVSRFKAPTAGAPAVYSTSERVVLVAGRPSASTTNHNGGAIVFGKDGNLYISVGDGGRAGDYFNRAQSPRYLNGKILRIRVFSACSGHLYCVPRTNPYYGSKVNAQVVFARGFRNPWRMSVDPVTGYLWVGDVGQDRYEEIDVVKPTNAGANFGWSCWEGRAKYNASRCAGAYVAPVMTYCHPDTVSGCTNSIGGEAVTGGFVYRGSRYKATTAGRYFFGDYANGNLWLGTPGHFVRAGSLPGVSSFGVDDAREPYAVTLSGGLFRLSVRAVA